MIIHPNRMGDTFYPRIKLKSINFLKVIIGSDGVPWEMSRSIDRGRGTRRLHGSPRAQCQILLNRANFGPIICLLN